MTTTTVHVTPTEIPARDLPMGLVRDVLAVLEAHVLDVSVVDAMLVLSRLVDVTPVSRGGRPDEGDRSGEPPRYAAGMTGAVVTAGSPEGGTHSARRS